MTLFPLFINLNEKEVFLIGGGKQACEKILKLKPYGPKITVFSKVCLPEIESVEGLKLIRREFQLSDLDFLPALVIIAGEDKEKNHEIAEECRKKRIPVNTADDPAYCDFIFPSLISRGNLSIGICTNGASPATGIYLKNKIEARIPEAIEEILDYLEKKRPYIRQALCDKKQRFSFYYKLSDLCMELGRPLTEEEFSSLLKETAAAHN